MRTNIRNFIKDKSELNKFEQRIVNSFPENITSACASGIKGIGKSMFCFITTTHIFQFLEGLHVDDAYIRALDHFVFTIPQLMGIIDPFIVNTDYSNMQQYDLEHKYRILVIDDAGTHMGKYKFYTDVTNVDQLKKRFDVVREITSGLLMTTPAQEGLLSFLREYPGTLDIQLKYDRNGNTKLDRIVEIRRKREKWARHGKKAFPTLQGSIYVHDWAYWEYRKRKRKAIADMIKEEKDVTKSQFEKMYQVIKKLNPSLSKNEVFDRLSLDDDLKNVLNITS